MVANLSARFFLLLVLVVGMIMSLLWAAANFQAKPRGCKGSRFLHPTPPHSPMSSSAPSIFPVIKRVTKECKIKTHPSKWHEHVGCRANGVMRQRVDTKMTPFACGSLEPFSLWFHWKKNSVWIEDLIYYSQHWEAYSCTISHGIFPLTTPNPLEECGAHLKLSGKWFAYLIEAAQGVQGPGVSVSHLSLCLYTCPHNGDFALSGLPCRSGLCTAQCAFLSSFMFALSCGLIFREVP